MCLCLEEGLTELAVQAEKVGSKLVLSCNDRKHVSVSSGPGQWFWYSYTRALGKAIEMEYRRQRATRTGGKCTD